jgi:hypothetical protein
MSNKVAGKKRALTTDEKAAEAARRKIKSPEVLFRRDCYVYVNDAYFMGI